MLLTIIGHSRSSREKRFSSDLFLYLVLLTISSKAWTSQQIELPPPKTDPFYIDLHHKFSSEDSFKPRGSIFIRPKTEYRAAQATFTQQQHLLSESDIANLKGSSERGDTYYLKATLRKKKTDLGVESNRYTQTIVKSCSLTASNLADTLLININSLNEFISLNLITTDPECHGGFPQNLSSEFNTTIQLYSGSLGPQPDTAAYIRWLEEERKNKQKEGKEDNRSFLAKYWFYIVPAVIILMMLGGPEQAAR